MIKRTNKEKRSKEQKPDTEFRECQIWDGKEQARRETKEKKKKKKKRKEKKTKMRKEKKQE